MNLYDYLCRDAAPEHPAVISSGSTVSFGALRRLTEGIAVTLTGLGVKKQDRVGILADNSPFWIASYLAAIKIGAIAVPFPNRLSDKEVEGFCEAIGCHTFCVDGPRAKRQGLVAARIPDAAFCLADDRSFPAVVRTPALGEECATAEVQEHTELASLMFTSGSTGTPNAVRVSHRNLIANTASILRVLQLSAQDRICAILPFDYCFGASLLHTHLRAGGTVILSSSLFLEDMLDEMQRYGCTGLAAVPTVYQRLIRESSFRDRTWPHLRYLQQAGGRLAEPFLREYLAVLPDDIRFFVMYGQTEATARLTWVPPERLCEKLGSVGKCIPGVNLWIERSNGDRAAVGEVGEIVAAGDSITLGYLFAPLDRQPFRDGRLYTGDIGYVDQDGYFYLTGRDSDFIKPNGNRISCGQIEAAIAELPEVLEVAVIGVNHRQYGEGAKAFIVPKGGAQILPEDVVAHCKRRLPGYAVPCEIEVTSDLPKNTTGKIMKRLLTAEIGTANRPLVPEE